MTDATKDAIERVRMIARDGIIQSKATWDNDRKAMLRVADELDRLTKPIEAQEVADTMRDLAVGFSCSNHIETKDRFWKAHSLLDRLARENERLRAERDQWERNHEALQEKFDCNKSCGCAYDHADALCGYHSPQVIAAEARAERLAEALRAIRIFATAGSHIFRIAETAINEPKAGTE